MHHTPSDINVPELKSYLGLLRHFLPHLSTTLDSLYLISQTDTQWHWNSKQESAFLASKRLLLSSQVVVHFDPDKELLS